MEKKTHNKICRFVFLVFALVSGCAYLYLMFKSCNEDFLGVLLLIMFISSIIISNQHEILAKLSN